MDPTGSSVPAFPQWMSALPCEAGPTWIWKVDPGRTRSPIFEIMRRESRSLSGPDRPRCSWSSPVGNATTSENAEYSSGTESTTSMGSSQLSGARNGGSARDSAARPSASASARDTRAVPGSATTIKPLTNQDRTPRISTGSQPAPNRSYPHLGARVTAQECANQQVAESCETTALQTAAYAFEIAVGSPSVPILLKPSTVRNRSRAAKSDRDQTARRPTSARNARPHDLRGTRRRALPRHRRCG